MSTLLKKPTSLFLLFIFAHFIGWTVVPALTRYNLPLDSIEGALWGQQLEWGYDKNPYLNGWLTALAHFLGGESGWLVYAFSQLSVMACFIAVYKLGCRMLNPIYALIAVLLLEGIQYFNLHAIDFNDNTLELGLWGVGIYFFYLSMLANKDSKQAFLNWGLTGLSLGLGMMAKYYTLALLAGMFCFMVSNKERRAAFLSPATYFGLAAFLSVTLPHFIWLFSHDFITVKYVFARGSSVPQFSNHFFFPAQFAWQQFEAFLPALVLCLLFFFRKKSTTEKTHISAFDKAFLWYVGFGPFLLTLLLSLTLGTNLRAGWGMPLLSLWTLSLISMLKPTVSIKKLSVFIFTIFLLLSVLLFGYYRSLTHSRTESSANFPGQELAARITEMWHEKYHTPLHYVAGSRWIGGNIAFYSKDHPRVFIEWDKERAPWINAADLQQKGAVFVWDIRNGETLPEEVAREFPELSQADVLTFSWKRDKKGIEPVKIGIAILAPLKNI